MLCLLFNLLLAGAEASVQSEIVIVDVIGF
jgi:hypothetical protein